MKFSILKQKITPYNPVFLSGFSAREGKSTEVLDDIYMKAVLLQANDEFLILTFDVMGGDRGFVDGVKEQMLQKFGLKKENIILNFSHTHASIYLTSERADCRKGFYSIDMERFPESEDELDYTADIEYYHWILGEINTMVERAYEKLLEGNMEIAKGSSDSAVSRRLKTSKGIVWAPDKHSSIDNELFVVLLKDNTGITHGVLFNFACHPTAMGTNVNVVSSEFVGYACSYLESVYPQTTAVFLQGCAAELKPTKSAKDDCFFMCSVEEMQDAGKRLGEDVESIIRKGGLETIKKFKFQSLLLDPELYALPYLPDDQYHPFGKMRRSIPLYITLWQFNENVNLIALEGEVANDYAKMIKKIFPSKYTMVLGYSNGVPTYIPTRRMLQDGGYEAEAYKIFGRLTGPFVPEIEDIIIGQIVKAKWEFDVIC